MHITICTDRYIIDFNKVLQQLIDIRNFIINYYKYKIPTKISQDKRIVFTRSPKIKIKYKCSQFNYLQYLLFTSKNDNIILFSVIYYEQQFLNFF